MENKVFEPYEGYGTLTIHEDDLTNGDRIRMCNNEQLAQVRNNLKTCAIYADGRLLDSSYEDFILWLDKVSDDTDINTIFKFL